MSNQLPWSWSRLSTFEQCPRKFYLQNISKELKYVQTPQAVRGEQLHKMLELAAKKIQKIYAGETLDAGFPKDIMHVIPLLYKLLKGADAVLIEEGSHESDKYALDDEFNKVGYFAKNAWLRFGIDFAVKHGKRAIMVDWKTGKNYGYTDQNKLFAAIIMEVIWPDVDEVSAWFLYLDQNETSKRVFYRKDLDDMWDDLIGRSYAITRAAETNQWLPKKNNFCNWCDANPNQCELKGK